MGLRHEMLQVRVVIAEESSTHSLLYSIAHLSNKDLPNTYLALGIAPNAGDIDT